jgi:hypothetical protein
MPDSPLISAGANIDPTSAAPLFTNRMFTGLWTQRSYVRDAATPFLMEKYYSASRFDSLVGGMNTEISARLTLVRRPGHSRYNSSPMPPVNRFYEFRAFSAVGGEKIHVLSSSDPATGSVNGTVRDVTGPSNNVILWTKDSGAGKTAFQSVGNICFFSDGVDAKKWVTSSKTWAANATATITSIQIVRTQLGGVGPFVYILVLTLGGTAPTLQDGSTGTFSGITHLTALNGQTLTWHPVSPFYNVSLASNQIAFFYGSAAYPATADTGSMVTVSASQFSAGDFIVDTNNNLQFSMGSQTATITNIQIDDFVNPGGTHSRKVTLFFASATPIDVLDNIALTLAGLTTIAALNGTTPYTVVVVSSTQLYFVVSGTSLPITAYSAETGTATTGNGNPGGTQPTWNTNVGLVTQDGGLQWVNMGSAVQNWGFDAPLDAPTVTQVAAPSVYPVWAANTWYAPFFVIVDSNSNVQQLITAGTTGGVQPTWNLTVGGTTADNTATWKNLGPEAWAASTAFTVGQTIVVTWTYTFTTQEPIPTPPYTQTVTHSVTITAIFQCSVAGTTGTNQPSWNSGLGTTTQDNTVTWTNYGAPLTWTNIGAGAALSLATKVVDSNGNLQTSTGMGETGATAPTWATDVNAITNDGMGTHAYFQTWNCAGPYSPAASFPWKYAYSGKSSITKHVSTASPVSQPITVANGKLAVIQGAGVTDPQEDTIVIWRTVQNGSTLLYLDEFPNPGSGQTWIYTDTTPDTGLNELIIAPIAGANNRPPAGFIPIGYHLNRIWGYVDNVLYYSGGPDTTTGSGNEAFPPGNQFTLQSAIVGGWATSLGLIVFRVDGITLVLGQGTSSSRLYVVNIYDAVGLASADGFDTRGSTVYLMTPTAKVLNLTTAQFMAAIEGTTSQTLEEAEVGFPIGDLITAEYSPEQSFLTWHEGPSEDTGLFVGDGAYGWYRMGDIQQPEQCKPWSPQALIANGVKAIKSIEIAPGEKRLLLGPAQQGGYILERDYSTYEDDGTPYVASATFGNVVMAQPGTYVTVQYIVDEVKDVGSVPSVGVLYDELEGTFTTLVNSTTDPVNLPPSETLPATRWHTMQSGGESQKCRHMQIEFAWPAENYANELVTFTIYGRLPQKAKK